MSGGDQPGGGRSGDGNGPGEGRSGRQEGGGKRRDRRGGGKEGRGRQSDRRRDRRSSGSGRRSGAPSGAGQGAGDPTTDPSADQPGDLVYGRHAVDEALRAGESIGELLLAGPERGPERGPVARIATEARRREVPIRYVPRAALDRLTGGARHQGVAARVAEYRYRDLDEIVARAMSAGEPLLVLALDAIQDVHNLGSLLRSAEAAGAHGVMIADREAAGITPAVRNASAGAVAHILVARLPLHEGLEALARRGVSIVGLDGEGEREVLGGGGNGVDLTGPVALVVGSEGRGLSAAVSRRCDHVARLPMAGRVESLNAAVAGSILLYEVLRQRRANPPAAEASDPVADHPSSG